MKVRHRVFNPMPWVNGLSVLDAICTDMEKDGWVLINVVPHHQYESVAIFQLLEEHEEENDATDRAYL